MKKHGKTYKPVGRLKIPTTIPILISGVGMINTNKNMKITIECEMKDKWVPHFLGMLYHMEKLGKLGSSRRISIYADGDGDFRPRFKCIQSSEPLPLPAKPVEEIDGNTIFDAG
jgi:hypothetical protein